MKKVLLFWSGGKDSALTYFKLKKDPNYQVVGLISTLDKEFNGIPFHGIKEGLLVQQAAMLSLPLQRIYLPKDCSNVDYKIIVGKFLTKFKKANITTVAFGDIHLKDVKEFRDTFINELEMETVYPLLGMPSDQVAQEFFETGHRAVITSLLREKMEYRFLGKEYNKEFIEQLPNDVDVAGENGEFHTFVSFSPYFKMRMSYSKGTGIDIGPYLVCKLQDA
jgi:uncharacterized protein (TIGR00290 family)